jgi:hypothetical protein
MLAPVLALLLAQSSPGEPSAGRQRFDAYQAGIRSGALHIYPLEAERLNLPGFALIECAVDDEGWLEDCLIVTEEPMGQGFGEAAMKMAPGFRKPQDSGHRIQLPIDFKAGPPELPGEPTGR